MKWIVLGEKNGRINLVSKSEVQGILPKGAFLTIEDGVTKFILRVEDSAQLEPYSPTPLIVDMDLSPLQQDRVCKNIISAYRIHNFSKRQDGLIDYIKPQSIARLSNQEEIDAALGNIFQGPKVFIATIQYDQNQLLKDENGKLITVSLPDEMFFHQILICGKTGSGKTVAIKYLSQYFTEEFNGAVLAINVKDVDLLKMDLPTPTVNEEIIKEWEAINKKPSGLNNFTIYHPANTNISLTKRVNKRITQKITLDVKTIQPESLTGLLQNISDIGAMNFPNIFRYWQENQKKSHNIKEFTFSNFIQYYRNAENDGCLFSTMNFRGEEATIRLHRGTYDNILRNLDVALEFFDNEEATVLEANDILQIGKMSVIDVSDKNGIQFGSIILRDLLSKIVHEKKELRSEVPILIIIDEVHMFYDTNASFEALGDLDTICRTGRSQKIGVIFSSQNPQDIPKGLSSVINTKIFFKSDAGQVKTTGVSIQAQELESLKKGYAIVNIHELSQIKIVKFPLALAGVLK